MSETLSKSEFARLLGAAKSTISALSKRGLPQQDGKIPRDQALRWLAHNTSGFGGGWGGMRSKDGLAQRAARLLKGGEAEARPITADPELEPIEHVLLDSIYRQGYEHLPAIALWLAEQLRRCGEHAPMVGAIVAHDILDSLCLGSEDFAPDYRWAGAPEPDYTALARKAGLPISPKEWERHAERITDELSDFVSLLGLWGPDAKRNVEAAAKKKRGAGAQPETARKPTPKANRVKRGTR